MFACKGFIIIKMSWAFLRPTHFQVLFSFIAGTDVYKGFGKTTGPEPTHIFTCRSTHSIIATAFSATSSGYFLLLMQPPYGKIRRYCI